VGRNAWSKTGKRNFLHFFREREGPEKLLVKVGRRPVSLRHSDNSTFTQIPGTFSCRRDGRARRKKIISPDKEMNVWMCNLVPKEGDRTYKQKVILELTNEGRLYEGCLTDNDKARSTYTIKLTHDAFLVGSKNNFLTVVPLTSKGSKCTVVIVRKEPSDDELKLEAALQRLNALDADVEEPLLSQSASEQVAPTLAPSMFAKYSSNHRNKEMCEVCNAKTFKEQGYRYWFGYTTSGRHLCTRCGKAIGNCCGIQIGWCKKWVCNPDKAEEHQKPCGVG